MNTTQPTSSMSSSTTDVTAARGVKTGEQTSSPERKQDEVSFLDRENPLLFSQRKKALILFVVCSIGICVTAASSVIATTYTSIERELGVSHEVAILTLSLFVLGLAVAPPLVGPFSEEYGRRPVYLISFGSFFLLTFPVAFANNLAVLLIFRFLTGVAGSAFLNVAGGTIADMWVPKETFMPLALFTSAIFCGPVVGPVYGSFVSQFSSQWRWAMWVILIWAFVDLIALFVFCQETFAPVLLRRKAERDHTIGEESAHAPDEKAKGSGSNSTTVAIASKIGATLKKIPLLLVHEPMLALLCLWMGLILAIIYVFFELFPIVFAAKGLQTYQVGLTFLGILVSNALALATMPFWRYQLAAADVDPKTNMPPPEARLTPAKVGCLLTPIGLFIFAFTSYPHVHWVGPIIGSAVFGVGTYYLFFSIFSYTTSNWRPVAASAMGANSMVRCIMAGAFPLFATQMVRRLGSPGAVSLLAGLNCLMIPVPFILTHYGPAIRARSRFTS